MWTNSWSDTNSNSGPGPVASTDTDSCTTTTDAEAHTKSDPISDPISVTCFHALRSSSMPIR